MNTDNTVTRVVRRKAKPGCMQAYEELVKGMLEASSRFPGYLGATVIPPHTDTDEEEYQIIQRFATQADLNRWDQSSERAMWHERIHPIADDTPIYRLVSALDVWFHPERHRAPAPRWKMTTVSWLGIFPTVALCLGVIAPLLASWPFLLRTAMITALVAVLMSYLVMPKLSNWMRWWLKH
jgi:antibiotic biosynthesis monooxygenase (ABM) superfamily enzyme